MRVNRFAVEAVVAGILIAATVLQGLAIASSQTLPSSGGGQSFDSTTVDRLSRMHFNAEPASIQATTDVTGTLAAILATHLLLAPISYDVNLPVVIKQ